MSAAALPSIAGTTAKVVRFNWPKYAAAFALAALAILAPDASFLPPAARSLLIGAAALGCAWAASSLLATWWVYDHRHVYEHVAEGLDPIGKWATVHAGFDDATNLLTATIGRPPHRIIDVPSDARASLRRATTASATHDRPAVVDLDAGAGAFDTIFLTFAIHEVRNRHAQRALFAELHRTLRPGGQLVITEHLRDLANAAVYGPGALHFLPGRIWRAGAEGAGFTPKSETAITPFVRRFTWTR